MPDSLGDGGARIDPLAIAKVREQLWPDVRDEHELHDLLLSLVALPIAYLESEAARVQSTHAALGCVLRNGFSSMGARRLFSSATALCGSPQSE